MSELKTKSECCAQHCAKIDAGKSCDIPSDTPCEEQVELAFVKLAGAGWKFDGVYLSVPPILAVPDWDSVGESLSRRSFLPRSGFVDTRSPPGANRLHLRLQVFLI